MKPRKPHQHEQDGRRFDCSNPECRMPFKVTGPALPGETRFKASMKRKRERKQDKERREIRILDSGWQAYAREEGHYE